jgi:hypothetical protein
MAKASKKKNGELPPEKRRGKASVEKPLTASQIRYLELLKRMEELDLPPTDIVGDERKIRALEGY